MIYAILALYIFSVGIAGIGEHFEPKFYDNTQEISLELPQNTTFNIEKGTKEHKDDSNQITVKRSFSTLKGTLSKKGFEDKEIELKSHFTTDKWAIKTSGHYHTENVSAFYLLPPNSAILDTITTAKSGVESSPHPIITPISGTYGAVLGLAGGVFADAVNLVISIPSVIIYNPWYEYDNEIDLSNVILPPTPEFETKCHSQKNTFIGNNDCLSCSNQEHIISTQEECSRCLNREWTNGNCLLKNK